MKRKRTRKLGALSLAEAQRLLGSGKPTAVGKLPADPLGIRMTASILRERLVSRGGRPSDPAWTIVRKVPMRPDTWAELDRCAKKLQEQNLRISAGQIAAITLERALQAESKDEDTCESPTSGNYAISGDVQLIAHRVHLALTRGGLFQCV